jgi:hypothetical protein
MKGDQMMAMGMPKAAVLSGPKKAAVAKKAVAKKVAPKKVGKKK